MNMRKLGQTQIEVPAAALGTWAIGGDSNWGPSQDELSIRTIQEAKELGINFIDTAPAYGQGHSEEVVGKAIEGHRKEYILSSKCGLVWDLDEGYVQGCRDGVTLRRDLSPAGLRRQLEQSLRRLHTDYIDVFITHWQSMPPNLTPIEETMDTLQKFCQEGKIRAVGISNVTPEQIERYAACGPIALVQQKYSMLDRTCEADIIPVCQRLGITFQAYSPLERGLLTGKVTMETEISGNAKKGLKWYEPEHRKKVLDLLEEFRPLCKKYETSMASLIIAWTAAQKDFFQVLCGARKPEQIRDNVQGASLELDREDAAWMDRMARAIL